MDEVAERPKGEICHRCMQPVPSGAQRCPHCGSPLQSLRRVSIYIGIGGMLALVFVIWVMITVVRNADIETSPPKTEQSAPQPEKPPPLNQ
jgi:ribosomal protein L40E